MIIILCPIYFTEYDFENLGGSLNAKLPDSGLQPPSLPLLIHAQAVKVHSPDLDRSPIIVIKVIIEEQEIVFRVFWRHPNLQTSPSSPTWMSSIVSNLFADLKSVIAMVEEGLEEENKMIKNLKSGDVQFVLM